MPTSEINYILPIVSLDVFDFLPIVKLENPSKNTKETTISSTDEEVNLSNYLDDDKRTFKCKQISTEKRKLKLKFIVEKAGEWSFDSDGAIECKLSIEDSTVKIIGQTEFQAEYGTEIEIDISAEDDKELYIDFYAKDDYEDIVQGKQDLFCGRVKYLFEYCVCSDWATVASVIPSSKFIGWGHPGIKKNCYHYVVEQLRVAGHKVKSPGWGTKFKMNKYIYQLFMEANVAGMQIGVQKKQFEEGVKYLKQSIQNNIPVMVGVDDDYKTYNTDKTTEHFVTIVGMGEDTRGNYFLFYDNATGAQIIGTSLDNKIYCDCKNFKLESSKKLNISYVQDNTAKKKYIITQIRETK